MGWTNFEKLNCAREMLLRKMGWQRTSMLLGEDNVGGWINRGRFIGLPPPIGGAGFSLPSIVDARIEPLRTGRPGNWLVLSANHSHVVNTKFEIKPGAKGNVIVLGSDRGPASVTIHGDDNIAIIGEDIRWPLDAHIRFSSNKGVMFWGRAGSTNGSEVILEGDGCNVIIGDDCMFAAQTSIRTSDLHGIRDALTQKWLNPPASVVVEPHVWVGHGAMVAKGAQIGAGAVIGARALVTRPIAAASIAVGVPAKVIREGVEWTRERNWL